MLCPDMYRGKLICRRVCEVRLFGQHKFEIKQQKYKISQELKEGQAKVLFGMSLPILSSHEFSNDQLKSFWSIS
jgi:hexokinase